MATELTNPNTLSNGDLQTKKSRESDRRRRRRKQKKNKNQNNNSGSSLSKAETTEDDDSDNDTKENFDTQQPLEIVEIEYVPEKADLEDGYLEEFKKVFEKFSFSDAAAGASDDNEKKDEVVPKKKVDSDSDEEEQDLLPKDKGVSNKKKKLQRRMNIAELKQICARPDVVEVWDATAADPKLLVFLKSYRNTVPVPRHWSQKRKFLQGSAVTFMEPGLVGVY